jgi:hypothetical protein
MIQAASPQTDEHPGISKDGMKLGTRPPCLSCSVAISYRYFLKNAAQSVRKHAVGVNT